MSASTSSKYGEWIHPSHKEAQTILSKRLALLLLLMSCIPAAYLLRNANWPLALVLSMVGTCAPILATRTLPYVLGPELFKSRIGLWIYRFGPLVYSVFPLVSVLHVLRSGAHGHLENLPENLIGAFVLVVVTFSLSGLHGVRYVAASTGKWDRSEWKRSMEIAKGSVELASMFFEERKRSHPPKNRVYSIRVYFTIFMGACALLSYALSYILSSSPFDSWVDYAMQPLMVCMVFLTLTAIGFRSMVQNDPRLRTQ